MNDTETQNRFILLRSQGLSFARIADELHVSKPTLIAWSRKFQFQIQNLRVIELEAVKEKWLASREAQVDALGQKLRAVEAELDKRDLTKLSTAQLYYLANTLRRQIQRETGQLKFTVPTTEIPSEEFHDQVQDWMA